MCVYTCAHTCHSMYSLGSLFCPIFYMGPEDITQIIRLAQLSHLASPHVLSFFWKELRRGREAGRPTPLLCNWSSYSLSSRKKSLFKLHFISFTGPCGHLNFHSWVVWDLLNQGLLYFLIQLQWDKSVQDGPKWKVLNCIDIFIICTVFIMVVPHL